MTIKLKILVAMGLAFVVALVIGGASLQSLHQAGENVRSIYEEQLVTIVNIEDVRLAIYANRTAYNRALLQASSSDEGASLKRTLEANHRLMDSKWAEYFPARVNTDGEMSAARAFMAERARNKDIEKNLLSLLDSGQHAQAVTFMTSTLGPAFQKETDVINKIVDINREQAHSEYVASMARQHSAVVLSAIILALGALAVFFSWLVLTKAIMRPLLQAKKVAEQINRGELNQQLQVDGRDELSDTLRALASMDHKLTEVVSGVRDHAHQVARATEDISAGNDSLSQRTQEQASSLEETAASMEQMTATVRHNADSTNQARAIAENLRQEASKGHEVITHAISAMDKITESSRHIGEIAVLIDEIAFQTNLLALNAAVEAARAGDQGRGFSVVASEVRSLAQRSAAAAKDIKLLINDSAERVTAGADLVGQTGQALNTIQSGASKVSALISEIAAASSEQSAGIDQVNDAVTQLDQVTQENAALVEEASAAARHTMDIAQDLIARVAFFQIMESQPTLGQASPAGVRPTFRHAGARLPAGAVA